MIYMYIYIYIYIYICIHTCTRFLDGTLLSLVKRESQNQSFWGMTRTHIGQDSKTFFSIACSELDVWDLNRWFLMQQKGAKVLESQRLQPIHLLHLLGWHEQLTHTQAQAHSFHLGFLVF